MFTIRLGLSTSTMQDVLVCECIGTLDGAGWTMQLNVPTVALLVVFHRSHWCLFRIAGSATAFHLTLQKSTVALCFGFSAPPKQNAAVLCATAAVSINIIDFVKHKKRATFLLLRFMLTY